ncbi:hypothetical protein [Egicoccus sp. AB-alg6-2]|uniref:hypothetical protein n=1 Tax=Egicoccus sp. AB-alg6-2 TaxID=3242692 RepID=UPI00359F01C4
MELPPIPPSDALADLLPGDVDLDDAGRLRHEAARPVWYGMVWSRLGRGDLAWAHWDRVHLPELQPWIGAERGRVLRELGLHARAEALEWPALLDAVDPVDAAMLRVSLAADAVGLGDLDRARRRLAAATEAVAALPDSPRAARQRLRLAWVDVEVAALEGRPLPTDRLPYFDEASGEPQQPHDALHGTRFHHAKGLLFGGVVRGDRRLLDAAAAIAPPVIAWAVHLARADLPATSRDAEPADEEAAARAAWAALVLPPGVDGEVASTPVARRLHPAVPGGADATGGAPGTGSADSARQTGRSG